MTNKDDIEQFLEATDKLTETQQRAADLLTSIITVLNDALIINFSDEEKKGFLTNDVSAEKLWEGSDELWEQFVKTNLTERPKLKKKSKQTGTENYHGFLQRHGDIFVEINELKNIKDLDPSRIAKLLRWLEKEKWYKLFRIVLSRYSNLQQNAESKLLSILTILKEASIIALGEENPNRFFANDAEANTGWESFIEIHFTENPKLNEGETFHDFLRRHRLIFLAINNLDAKIPDGERVLELLFQLMEVGWDKLFCTVLDRYLISDVHYKREAKLFDINGKSEKYYGKTLVQGAIKNNNVVILQKLIKSGADLNTVALVFDRVMKSTEDAFFFTALHEAVVNESYECMQILIDEGVELNLSKVKDSALHYAARRGSIKTVKLLVDSGAKLNEKDSRGMIPYQLAHKEKRKHCMQYLAVEMRRREIPIPGETSKDDEADAVELKSINGFTPSREDIPLHHAFPEGVLDLILSFLNSEAIKKMRRLNHFFAEFSQKNTMWENFVKEKLTGYPRLLEGENFYNFLKRKTHQEILLDYQKSKQIALNDSRLFGLLQSIAEVGWEKLFITVLDNNPEFNVNGYISGDLDKKYLIHTVVANDSTVMLLKLIDRKANLRVCAAGYVNSGEMGEWTEGRGNNPLQEAVKYGAHSCIKLLLAYKNQFDINQRTSDNKGQSALHLAARKGDIDSVKLLVEVGQATLDQQDSNDNIPYVVAMKKNNKGCADYLAQAMDKANLPIPKASSCVLQ